VVVGINLLREGLDLPEVSLVAVLDADKSGFLRNERSLIQTIGRAARNEHGMVLLYGDSVTDGMRNAIDETRRRRAMQEAYNRQHGITPRTIVKSTDSPLAALVAADYLEVDKAASRPRSRSGKAPMTAEELVETAARLRKEMRAAAARLEFEKAAELRDRVRELESWL
jgi:excinuclease ABC subunit B